MKFNQSVRNQPPPVAAAVAAGPATAQPGAPTAGATPSDNLLGMLTAAEPQQQKQIIGEHLYRQIFSMHPDLSGKITGKWSRLSIISIIIVENITIFHGHP